MNLLILVALLAQSGDYSPALKATTEARTRETQLREIASVVKTPERSVTEENTKAYTAARDQEFVGKFNKLINRLMEFADTYKDGKTLDIKKAQAIRRAWLELEKSEAIFREEKKK